MSTNQTVEQDAVRNAVRDRYGAIVRDEESSCCGGGCCGGSPAAVAADRLGYTAEDVAALPEGADLGLGCGNPTALAALTEGETVLDAAYRNQINLPMDCSDGVCGTCKGSCQQGQYELGEEYIEEALTDDEAEQGMILTCQMVPSSDCVVNIPAASSLCKTGNLETSGTVAEVNLVSATAIELKITADEDIAFLPGQYVNIRIPGTSESRAYSFSSRPGSRELNFLIRNVPGGLMSSWLVGQAKTGDKVTLAGPMGIFYLRPVGRPLLMLAGGTGLAPFLSMLEHLQGSGAGQPVHLIYGVTREADIIEEVLRVYGYDRVEGSGQLRVPLTDSPDTDVEVVAYGPLRARRDDAVGFGPRSYGLDCASTGDPATRPDRTSAAAVTGLVAIHFTGIHALDSLFAIGIALFILWQGVQLVRRSIGGIMDETDMTVAAELVRIIDEQRHPAWIDLHNFRLIKFGSTLHIDCHVTLPWYYTLERAHEEITELDELMATACAVQNMYLTCSAYGLGAFWATGAVSIGEGMRKFTGLADGDRALGLFYIGYPAIEWPKGYRAPLEKSVTWHLDR